MKARHKAELEDIKHDITDNLSPDTRISIHEKICALRYGVIDSRLSRIELILVGSTASLITGMAVVIWELIKGHVGG